MYIVWVSSFHSVRKIGPSPNKESAFNCSKCAPFIVIQVTIYFANLLISNRNNLYTNQ